MATSQWGLVEVAWDWKAEENDGEDSKAITHCLCFDYVTFCIAPYCMILHACLSYSFHPATINIINVIEEVKIISNLHPLFPLLPRDNLFCSIYSFAAEFSGKKASPLPL